MSSVDAEHQTSKIVEAQHIDEEVAACELDHVAWQSARPVHLTRYWSGADAPPARHAEARLIWTDDALCVRFAGHQNEPLVIGERPQSEQKTIGLWDRDVCEIFIAPDARVPERYFEFEAAPTGEWLDLAIHRMPDGQRETLWDFNSGMTTAARIAEGMVTIVMRLPFKSLTTLERWAPQFGARWRINLLRCVGANPDRGYLAWQPTHTAQPDFHVPEKFGWLHFKGKNEG